MASSKSNSTSTAKADSSQKKVFDVSKPGKSAPSASSKPIIITNRPILRDPMVTGDSGTETITTENGAPLKPNREVTISPVNVTDSNAASETKPEDKSPEQIMDSLPPETDKAEEPESKPQAKETTADSTAPEVPVKAEEASKAPEEPRDSEAKPAEASSDAAKTASPMAGDTEEKESEEAPSPSTDKQLSPEEQQAAEEAAAKAEAEHNATIQKMVDSKQYYLPINSVEKRKTQHFVIGGIILAVVLGLVWVDIALDAGLIHLGGVKAVTHFFSR